MLLLQTHQPHSVLELVTKAIEAILLPVPQQAKRHSLCRRVSHLALAFSHCRLLQNSLKSL
jgi:hypothetical protein